MEKRIEGGRKGKRKTVELVRRGWHQKTAGARHRHRHRYRTRWWMFGNTGVNGGCRSAGTEFLGTALATMETVLYK